jgi:hypothetical protein
MALRPRKFPPPWHPGRRPLDAGPHSALAIEAQIILLGRRIEELSVEVADLRSQLEAECVRQTSDGDVHFPAATRVNMSVGNNTMTLEPAGISISSAGTLSLDASGSFRLDASGSLRLDAAGALDLTAGAINANTSRLTTPGFITCGTLQANMVIGASYTPGAGNLM